MLCQLSCWIEIVWVWQRQRQRLRQLLWPAGPLRGASVQPGHALAVLPHREVLSSELLPLFWCHHGLSFPQQTTVTVVVKLDSASAWSQEHKQRWDRPKFFISKNTPVLSSLWPLLYFGPLLNLICLSFAWQLMIFLCDSGIWQLTCKSNFSASFSHTCLSFFARREVKKIFLGPLSSKWLLQGICWA